MQTTLSSQHQKSLKYSENSLKRKQKNLKEKGILHYVQHSLKYFTKHVTFFEIFENCFGLSEPFEHNKVDICIIENYDCHGIS